jgi:hypothetical protein
MSARRLVGGWLAIGALLAASLSVAIPTRIRDGLGLRRFVTPEIAGCVMRDDGLFCTFASQSFVMNADGLHAVEFMPVAVGRRVEGHVRLALVDLAELRVIRSAEVRVADVLRDDVYRFEFAPVADSRDGRYRFDINALIDTRGIAARATRGDRYRDGALLWNDRTRWADLAFEADAGSRPAWRALWSYRKAPDARPGGSTALLALVVYWALLLAALAGMARLGRAA